MTKPRLRLAVSNPPEEHAEDADEWSTSAEELMQFLGTPDTIEKIAVIRSTIAHSSIADDAKRLAASCSLAFDLFVTGAAIVLVRGDDYVAVVTNYLDHSVRRADNALIRDNLTTLLYLYRKEAGP
ncbi:MAG TPA: hypothetical protein VG934_01030 [Candidatus Paceibacterota bacterium]|nr:hypothetical protein [Candidatus Paceibacterota bacterium]